MKYTPVGPHQTKSGEIATPYDPPDMIAHGPHVTANDVFGHRTMRMGHPVCSGIPKHCIAWLVPQRVTMREPQVLNSVYHFIFCAYCVVRAGEAHRVLEGTVCAPKYGLALPRGLYFEGTYGIIEHLDLRPCNATDTSSLTGKPVHVLSYEYHEDARPWSGNY